MMKKLRVYVEGTINSYENGKYTALFEIAEIDQIMTEKPSFIREKLRNKQKVLMA
jgi:hypothetical protein